MKRCSLCGEYKDLSEFYNNARMKDGLFPMCKLCFKEKRNGNKSNAETAHNIEPLNPELNFENESRKIENIIKNHKIEKTMSKNNNEEMNQSSNPLCDSEFLNQKIEPAGFNETPEEKKERAKLDRIKTGIMLADVLIKSQLAAKSEIEAEQLIFEKSVDTETSIKMPPKFIAGMFAHRLGQYATQQAQTSALFFGICREMSLNYVQEQEIDPAVRERWEKELDKSSISQEIMIFVKKQLSSE